MASLVLPHSSYFRGYKFSRKALEVVFVVLIFVAIRSGTSADYMVEKIVGGNFRDLQANHENNKISPP